MRLQFQGHYNLYFASNEIILISYKLFMQEQCSLHCKEISGFVMKKCHLYV